MVRATKLCVVNRCLLKVLRDGRCEKHQLRKSWQNTSARNLSRPNDWPSRKARVLVRDGFQCQLCGGREDLEVDHIVPVARGGSWELDNLWTLDTECHKRKSLRDRQG